MAGKRRADGPARKRPSAQPTPAQQSWPKRLLVWGTSAGLVLALVGALAFVVLYRAIDIPDPNDDWQTQTTYVYYSDGEKEELGRFATQNRNSIPLSEMPEHVKDAVVAAEDRSFWTNRGIDPRGILRAAFSNATSDNTQGASTITQQYVKILYLTQDRTYERKLREAIMSLKLHRQQSKEQILEGYLNTIYFGRGAYGIDAAAQAYFGVPAKKLNLKQGAVLASVINNPTRFDPANGEAARAALEGRYRYVLDGMAEMDQITAAEAAKASAALPRFPRIKTDSKYGGQRGHALQLIRRELLRTGAVTEDQIEGGGLRIYTTLSRKAMRAAEEGVKEVQPEGLKGLHTAVATVEVGTGALRGFYAGHDYLDSQINWAVSGSQPGSTFKPFALAAGLEAGYSLRDTFEGNSPLQVGDAEIHNQGEGLGSDFGSAVNLMTATENSINTAFVDLTLSLPDGPDDVVEMATRLGLPPDTEASTMDRLHDTAGLRPDATVALGSATASPINMANAYATFANEGERAEVYVIEKVVDRNGEVLYRHRAKNKEVLEADIAADVTYALERNVQQGTGTNAAIGRPVAGKTGTATAEGRNGEDHVSSSWFVGYTPQYATAVMYARGKGNESLEGFLEPFYGGTYPAMTFASVMAKVHEGLEVEDFPPPAFVDGEAPESGHEPLPTATPSKKPSPTPTRTPSRTPTPTPTPTPSEAETTPPDDGNNGGGNDDDPCLLDPLDPSCPDNDNGSGNDEETTSSTTESPSPDAEAGASGPPGRPNGRLEEYSTS